METRRRKGGEGSEVKRKMTAEGITKRGREKKE